MKDKQLILIALAVLLVLTLFGCSGPRRADAANRRWERIIEQARIDAAMESIEQGRLQYAVLLLEDLIESESAFTHQALQILGELKAAQNEIAQARIVSADAELQCAIN